MGILPDHSDEKKGAVRLWEGVMMGYYSAEVANWYKEGSKFGPLLSSPAVRIQLLSQEIHLFCLIFDST